MEDMLLVALQPRHDIVICVLTEANGTFKVSLSLILHKRVILEHTQCLDHSLRLVKPVLLSSILQDHNRYEKQKADKKQRDLHRLKK